MAGYGDHVFLELPLTKIPNKNATDPGKVSSFLHSTIWAGKRSDVLYINNPKALIRPVSDLFSKSFIKKFKLLSKRKT